MRIFKYTGHALATLSKRTVKVSAAHELNDPFELAPTISQKFLTPSACAAFLRQPEEIEFHFSKEGLPYGVPFKKYERCYKATIPQRVKDLMDQVPRNAEGARLKFAETLAQFFLIFCGSHRRDLLLMWSHYAKEHTGSVIEFETRESPFL